MDESQTEGLVRRLVANPHDPAAIAEAHTAGQDDPEAYALLLERVGRETNEPALASHWLAEAANVWLTTFEDPHRGAIALMSAVDREPAADAPASRLAQLYADGGDHKALAALYERRARALVKGPSAAPNHKELAASLFQELGRMCSEPPLSDPRRARQAYAQTVELDKTNQFAIYTLRELYKEAKEFALALPLFKQEQELERDPERKLSLYLDEADVAGLAQKPEKALRALRQARSLAPDDAGLKQQVGAVVLEKLRAGQTTVESEREEACGLFVELAEEFPGEYGFLYSLCALELVPGSDRAMQLAIYYGEQEDRLDEVGEAAANYLAKNPGGALASDARKAAGDRAPAEQSAVARKPVDSAAEGSLAASAEGSLTAKAEGSLTASAEGSVARKKADAPAVEEPEGAVASEQATAASAEPDASAQPNAEGPAAVTAEAPVAAQLAGAQQLDDAPEEADEEDAGPLSELDALLLKAGKLAEKNRRNEAIGAYREVLGLDPIQPDALGYLLEQLPQKRKYAELKDVLLAAAATDGASDEQKATWLKEVASLCENQLRDVGQAASAWRQMLTLGIEPTEARDQLRRLLEKARRWDELADLLEEEAQQTGDLEVRISLEKQVAKLHTDRRKDPARAGQTWGRVARLLPGDDQPVLEAVKLFEQAERTDLAAAVISENVAALDDSGVRRDLYRLLATCLIELERPQESANALLEGARSLKDIKMWESAEAQCAHVGAWKDAAGAAGERAQLTEENAAKARLLATAAEYLAKAGLEEEALSRLQEAVELAPKVDEFALALEQHLMEASRASDVVQLYLTRATRIDDAAQRAQLCRRAALMCANDLNDLEGARAAFLRVLTDQEDVEALTWLANDALTRNDAAASVEYLERLSRVLTDPEDRIEVLLKEAELRAGELSDPDGALARYGLILSAIDPENEQAIALSIQLHLDRGNFAEAALLLETQLKVAPSGQSKLEAAAALADLYEQHLERQDEAMRVLALIHATDPDDFEATQRLCALAEKNKQWTLFAELMGELITIEGDENEISQMSLKLAGVLTDKLDRGTDALEVLGRVADDGDAACREEFVRLGDSFDSKTEVARRLVRWHGASAPSAARAAALGGAFDRFILAGERAEAVALAKELARSKNANHGMAEALEPIAVELKDLEALRVAHALKVSALQGDERSEEFVRQAEVLRTAGVAPADAISHGEQALLTVAPADAEPRLQRLASLATDAAVAIDVYERQIMRCKAADDRLNALCRAAEFAVERDAPVRARTFFDVALGASLTDEAVSRLLGAARKADEDRGGSAMRWVLAEALANGGQGLRDGGKTRASLLSRAAVLASEELQDLDKAFEWLATATVEHVQDETLDALEALAERAGDFARAEALLQKALEEVFDGPPVRKLLARRAHIRRNRLSDPAGAADDLKRLHDLSPGDEAISDELCVLLEQLGDYRGMVQLHEDQILRSRDAERRGTLARKVALLWQDELKDPRECADAWRRVLRLRSGDAEAKDGLARAKEAMLGAKAAVRVGAVAETGTDAEGTGPTAADAEPPQTAALAEVDAESAAAPVAGEAEQVFAQPGDADEAESPAVEQEASAAADAEPPEAQAAGAAESTLAAADAEPPEAQAAGAAESTLAAADAEPPEAQAAGAAESTLAAADAERPDAQAAGAAESTLDTDPQAAAPQSASESDETAEPDTASSPNVVSAASATISTADALAQGETPAPDAAVPFDDNDDDDDDAVDVDLDADDEIDADDALLVDEDQDDGDERESDRPKVIAQPVSIPPPLPPGRAARKSGGPKPTPPPPRGKKRKLPAPPPPPTPPRDVKE